MAECVISVCRQAESCSYQGGFEHREQAGPPSIHLLTRSRRVIAFLSQASTTASWPGCQYSQSDTQPDELGVYVSVRSPDHLHFSSQPFPRARLNN